jgi:hypothetical protein
MGFAVLLFTDIDMSKNAGQRVCLANSMVHTRTKVINTRAAYIRHNDYPEFQL